MKLANKKIAGAVAALMGVSVLACTRAAKEEGASKVVITAQAQMDAEDLAQAGEQLISPTTFHLADKVFKMVLEKDPSNKKAQLYRAALKQFTVYKGILARVRPLYVKLGYEKEYTKFLREELRESPVKYWLLDGKEDIQGFGELQSVVVAARNAANDFRKYLLANPNLDLTIYMNEFVFRSVIDQTQRDCTVMSNTPSEVVVTCDPDNSARRKMNSADVVLLRQMLAGEVLYITVLNSHSATGLEDILKPLDALNKRVSAGEITEPAAWKEKLKLFDSAPQLGKLRQDQSFSLLPALGSDFSGALEWALKFQAELCPKGDGALNRKGFVFENGVCIQTQEQQDGARKMLAYISQALTAEGIVQVHEVNKETGETFKARIKAFAWAKAPVQDLRSVLPREIDNCGNAKQWRDLTLGGILPDADADRIVTSDCEK